MSVLFKRGGGGVCVCVCSFGKGGGYVCVCVCFKIGVLLYFQYFRMSCEKLRNIYRESMRAKS